MNKWNAIVTDDDEDIAELIADIVEELFLNVSVHISLSGKNTLSLMKELQAKLVLTDIFMPDMDGIELIQQLRTEYPSLSIVAVSGGGLHSEESCLDLAKKLGADLVSEKPVANQDFKNCLIELMKAKGLS